MIRPEWVSRELASAVHCQLYVDKFFNGKTSEAEQRATGFKWTPGLASRVRYETGENILFFNLFFLCLILSIESNPLGEPAWYFLGFLVYRQGNMILKIS